MRCAALALLAVWFALAPPTPAVAQETISFLGESFVAAYRKDDGGHHAFVELVRTGETLKGWKKLVGVHRFPRSTQTPREAATAVAAELRARDPAARFELAEHPKTKEALVDFIVSDTASSVVEFNVFKYARAADGKGLVALQYAQRFVAGATDADEIRKVRRKAVDAAAAFGLEGLHQWFKP